MKENRSKKSNASKSQGQREKEDELGRVPRVQLEATANYKCLFFLDVGRMPAAIRDQLSVPHGKLL